MYADRLEKFLPYKRLANVDLMLANVDLILARVDLMLASIDLGSEK